MTSALPRAVRDAAIRARVCGCVVHSRTDGERVEWIEIRSRAVLPRDLHGPLVRAGYVMRRPTRADELRIVWRWTPPNTQERHDVKRRQKRHDNRTRAADR